MVSRFVGARYENTAQDPPSTYSYIFNTFVQPDLMQNHTKQDGLVKFFMGLTKPPTNDSSLGCTGAMIGGVCM